MRRVLTAFAVLLLVPTAARTGDVMFCQRMERVETALAAALETARAEEISAQATQAAIAALEEQSFFAALFISHDTLDTLAARFALLEDCRVSGDRAGYLELCAECLRETQNLKNNARLHWKMIL